MINHGSVSTVRDESISILTSRVFFLLLKRKRGPCERTRQAGLCTNIARHDELFYGAITLPLRQHNYLLQLIFVKTVVVVVR